MTKRNVPVYNGTLRNHSIRLPHCIRECSGIRIFGMRIKSIAFTTDVAIIKNINADAIIAVYPFTPQPAISQAVIGISDVPVFVGVGGGITGGDRSVRLAIEAENQGAFGVVVNAPISNEVISRIKEVVDIPVIATIVSDQMDIRSRIEAGADFLNVSGAAATPQIVRRIRAAKQAAQDAGAPLFVLDGAVIVGTAAQAECDRLCVVTAPFEVSVERIAARDGISPEMAARRLNAQTPEAVLTAKADYILPNTSTREALAKAANGLCDALIGEGCRA